ncbi:MAG: zinc ribbon domain-containing protein, partial [Verrucomicrobia bacterium]|nr:zinc ribbon domain-containing protein [Verrucomicrobiota bacterium]
MGLLKCDHCGGAVTAERQKGHDYYRCTKKLGPCPQTRYIREEALADHLRESIRGVSLSDEHAAKMLAKVEEWKDAERTDISSMVNTEQKRLAEAKCKTD